MTPITDPALLAALNSQPVTDPAVLAQLNGTTAPSTTSADNHGGFGDFVRAVNHNILAPIHGAAQFVENALPIPQSIKDQDNAATQQWNADYQSSTPDNAASYAGATVGTVLPFAVSGLGQGLEKGGAYLAENAPLINKSPLLSKILSGGAQGAAIGAISPVTEPGDYSANKTHQVELGSVLGGAAPILAKGAGAVGNFVKDSVAPFTNPTAAALQHLSNVLPADAFSGSQYRPTVSGVTPTLAQSYGGQELVQAEKAARNTPAGAAAFNAQKEQNDAARLGAIQNLAGTPADLQAAKAQRDAVTAPMRDALLTHGNPVDVSGLISKIKNVIGSPQGVNPQVASGAADLLKDIQSRALPSKNGVTLIAPDVLDAVRQNANDYLSKYQPHGIVGTKQQAAIVPIKNSITDAIESANPGYRDYLATFAKLSQPINTMEAAGSILGNLDRNPLGADRTPILNLSQIRAQINKAVNGSDYALHPDALNTLKNVEQDLQNETLSNSQRLPGSDTAYNFKASGIYNAPPILAKGAGAVLGAILGHEGGWPAMAAAAGGGYAGVSKLSDMANENTQKAMANLLMNPDTAQAIQQLRTKTPSALPKYLLNQSLVKALTN